MKLKIGVMGSALERQTTRIPAKAKKLAFEVGKAVAQHNCILINGACGGIPQFAAKGACSNDGQVIGISPAENLHEHIHMYKFPTKEFDIIFFTGFGFKGRNIVNVSNCDAVIIVAGSMGTLNEFSIAYDEGMIIGIMQGSGGFADFSKTLIKKIKKKTGSKVFYDADPHKLVSKIIRAVNKRHAEQKIRILTEKAHPTCYRCT